MLNLVEALLARLIVIFEKCFIIFLVYFVVQKLNMLWILHDGINYAEVTKVKGELALTPRQPGRAYFLPNRGH